MANPGSIKWALNTVFQKRLGPVSIFDTTSYCKISCQDWYLELSNRFEIWQASRQHCYQCDCNISKRCEDQNNYQSRGFETSRYLAIRRLIGYWNGTQVARQQWANKMPDASIRNDIFLWFLQWFIGKCYFLWSCTTWTIDCKLLRYVPDIEMPHRKVNWLDSAL